MSACRLLSKDMLVSELLLQGQSLSLSVFLTLYLWAQTAQRSTVCGSMAVHHAATESKDSLSAPPDVDSMSEKLFCDEVEKKTCGCTSHLGVAARSQSLTASLTAQTGPVPVLPERGHLLSCTQTHRHGDSHHGNQPESLSHIPTLTDMKRPLCLPKYTVLLHLGQMLGPPEKDEKLAAEKH